MPDTTEQTERMMTVALMRLDYYKNGTAPDEFMKTLYADIGMLFVEQLIMLEEV